MLRTYDTLIEVQAENPEEAIKEFEKLGDSIYDLELRQNCVNEETLTIREGYEGTEMPVIIEQPIYKLVKND
jgi:hypothetical protein